MTTTQDLRKFLTEEMQKLRDGTITAKSAATTALATELHNKLIASDKFHQYVEFSKVSKTLPSNLAP